MRYAIVVKETGEIVGRPRTVNPVVWPNGDVSHGSFEGMEYKNWKIVPIEYDQAPSEFYQDSAGGSAPEFDGKRILMRGQYAPRDITDVKKILCQRIDDAAEEIRGRSIAHGIGQLMVYLQKKAEAEACARDPNPKTENYPLLAATVGIDGKTLSDVAELVLLAAKQWVEFAAAVEKTRMAAKHNINKSMDVDAAISAHAKARWDVG